MALLNKFFPGRRKATPSSLPEPTNSIDIPFSPGQVRVLLFRECDVQGRKLLFDSSAIQKTGPQVPSQPPPVCPRPAVRSSGPGKSTASESSVPRFEGKQKKYTYGLPRNDHNDLGEMVWGTAAMNFRGTSLKVHWLNKPSRILCSQIFLTPPPSTLHVKPNASPPMNMSTTSGLESTNSDISSLDTTSMSSFNGGESSRGSSIQIDLNGSDQQQRWSSGTDSGVNSESLWTASTSSFPYQSTRSSFGSVYSAEQDRKASIDSSIQGDLIYGGTGGMAIAGGGGQHQHLQRRVMRHLSTSFENHSSLSDYIGVIGEHVPQVHNVLDVSQHGSSNKWRRNSEVIHNDRLSNPEMVRRKASGETISIPFYSHGRLNGGSGNNGSSRRAKLGIAVCVTLHESLESNMKVFFSEHVGLFESLLNRVRSIVEYSLVEKQSVNNAMFRAWKIAQLHIQDLFTAPRITYPIWLTLSSAEINPANYSHLSLANAFITELCLLLGSGDTKDTNFFISTLLTAILTNHLGWVASVAPIHANVSSGGFTGRENGDKIPEISKSHPYNALWAQMSDLYGAIGHPPKISRTIVVGKCPRTMNQILNVLTYFIRCGDIRKRTDDTCVLETQQINKVMENVSEHLVDLDTTPLGSPRHEENFKEAFSGRCAAVQQPILLPNGGSGGGGIYRTMSHISSLDQLVGNGVAMPIEALTKKKSPDMVKVLTKNVMNDIPNVFAYRDSRFVKQELRIGNFLMDTGMEMNQKVKREIFPYRLKNQEIKLMVTSPENQLINFVEEDGVEEHRDMAGSSSAPIPMNRSLSALITDNSLGSSKETTTLLWGIEPVKEGIDFDQWRHWERGVEISEDTRFAYVVGADEDLSQRDSAFLRRGLYTKSGNQRNSDHVRRSKLGRRKSGQNGMLNLREEQEDTTAGEDVFQQGHNDVVFVLGDNEQLVNLRAGTSSDNHPEVVDQEGPSRDPSTSSSSTAATSTPKKGCCNHKAKKHSGVKFNFEQYPQIAENYMRNKNFTMAGSEILAKAIKMERQMKSEGSSQQYLDPALMGHSSDEEGECEFCAGCKATGLLQTPSNASELEFSSEDNSYGQITEPGTSQERPLLVKGVRSPAQEERGAVPKVHPEKFVVALPMPQVREVAAEVTGLEADNNPLNELTKWGLVPSLMVGVTDHYIPDMVLQGIKIEATQLHWELNLKQDLMMSAQCAAIEQTPTENVAIVANVDDWTVRIISSNMPHSHMAHYREKEGGTIASYSTSVVSMLETVQAMWNTGLPAYHCMAFIESKLQEFYLLSESLATFLLATEFCSLDDLTKVLDVSANDIQLLLSVASTHAPQVTRKYGLSFR